MKLSELNWRNNDLKFHLRLKASSMAGEDICSLSIAQEPESGAVALQEFELRIEQKAWSGGEGEQGAEISNLQFPKRAHLGFQAHPIIIPRKKAIQTGPRNCTIPIIIAQTVGLRNISKNAIITAIPSGSYTITRTGRTEELI